MNESESLGNRLFRVVGVNRSLLFDTGKRVQLAYDAFNTQVQKVKSSEEGEIQINYPLGQRPDGQTIPGSMTVKKEHYIAEYQNLAAFALPNTGLMSLVMVIEMMIEDTVSEILMTFPRKLAKNRQMPINVVFDYDDISEARRMAIKELLYDLFYSSPKDVADTLEKVYSFNLLEIPEFMKYLEIKACRDIHVHNRGLANELYRKKSAALARVEVGEHLPLTVNYFLQSYEICLRLTEKLEERFHSVWPSSEYIEYQERKKANKAERATPEGAPVL